MEGYGLIYTLPGQNLEFRAKWFPLPSQKINERLPSSQPIQASLENSQDRTHDLVLESATPDAKTGTCIHDVTAVCEVAYLHDLMCHLI